MKDRILKVMSQTFGCPINENSSQENTPNWDSLKHLNLVIALEMEFDMDFEPEQIAKMKSFNEIMSVLGSQSLL